MNTAVYRNQYLLVLTIIIIGIALRSVEYASNRSFASDEALTAQRIVSISLKESFFLEGKPHSRMQSYPVGFLLFIKMFIQQYGASEPVLRLFPFLCGVMSVFVFLKLAAEVLRGSWLLLALWLFAFSRDLVYYASELKPYASDALITMGASLLFFKMINQSLSRLEVWVYVLLGALAVYISFPVVFVLISVGGTLMLYFFFKGEWEKTRQLLIMGLIWGASFCFYYWVSIRHITVDPILLKFWNVNFMPVNEGPVMVVQWFIVVLKRIFSKFLQLPTALAAVGFMLGVVSLFFQTKGKFIVLVVPILFTLFLSALKMYPFDGRTIIFLFPAVILIIVEGIRVLGQNKSKFFEKVVSGFLIVFLAFYPTIFGYRQFAEPFGAEEIKPVLQYIKENGKSDDLILVYQGALSAYQYYAPRYQMNNQIQVMDRKKALDFANHIREGKISRVAKRFWVIFTHVGFDARANARLVILGRLDSVAKRLDGVMVEVTPHSQIQTIENNISASAYLFSLGRNSP